MEAKLKQGIESATQKKIVKMIKDSKLKVQAQIQGDEIRVTGKSRDDLQAVMSDGTWWRSRSAVPVQKTSAINRDYVRFVHVRCGMNA